MISMTVFKSIRFAVFILSFLCSFLSYGRNDNPVPPGPSSGPQVPPNIVLQPDPQTQSTIGKLFDNKASYQYFHQYEKNILFKIPTK